MSSITAGTSAGTALVHTADTSGSLLLKTGGSATTAVTIDASQNVSLAVPLPVASGGTGTTSATFVSLTSNVTGTLPIANGGTGLATTPANGALDIGNGTGFTRTTLTGGTGISVTNGAGSITVATNSYIKTDLTKYDSTVAISAAIGSAGASCITVALTATTELVIFYGGGSAHAVVWDNANRVFGTAVLVRSVTFVNSGDVAAYGISSTSVLVCSLPSGTTALETVVLSISGTTVTVNTAVATTLAGTSIINRTPQENNGVGRILQTGTSYVLCYQNSTTQPSFRAITVSGTTPTVGAELAFTAGTTATYYTTYVYSSGLLVHISASATLLYAVPISVSGTTLTQGTQATTTTTVAQCLSAQLSNSKIAVAYANSTNFGAIVSITGTTASISSATLGFSTAASVLYMQTIGNQAMVVLNQAGTNAQVTVLTDSSGTAVVGTVLTNPLGATVGWYLVGCDASKIFLQANQVTSVPYFYTYGISGNNPVCISAFPNTNIGMTGSQPVWTSTSLGSYNSVYGNFENGSTMRTASYKTVPMRTNGNLFINSFDGASIPLTQQAVGFTNLNNAGIRSSLSNAACWNFYVDVNAASPVNQTVYFRRIELA